MQIIVSFVSACNIVYTLCSQQLYVAHSMQLPSFVSFHHWQGAERKTRDEERRAAKRKMTATGRKKLDELYHPVVDRSEFYAMSDMAKPPVLFSPAEDIDKVKKKKDLIS